MNDRHRGQNKAKITDVDNQIRFPVNRTPHAERMAALAARETGKVRMRAPEGDIRFVRQQNVPKRLREGWKYAINEEA